jgi:hypothetical protein
MLHVALIVTVFKLVFGAHAFPTFALLYLAHVAVLWPIARWSSKIGRQRQSFWLRFVLGG